ncbi:hypothetical protein PI124_g15607 [Phytophthora idaei]|nr:hypothetical protein PI125_g16118 [Phytophthora idaei]KAG3143492.1 hypothetical protein PI126_g14594 [Phytophthora idaei]KAG3239458.1 hypothetical protein PI124_g15607 [Phytophthora idaei]
MGYFVDRMNAVSGSTMVEPGGGLWMRLLAVLGMSQIVSRVSLDSTSEEKHILAQMGKD